MNAAMSGPAAGGRSPLEGGRATFIDVEIVRGRLQSVVDEAGAILMRTAFSSIVRESKDFACAILTRKGHMVVQSAQSIPAFLGTMTPTATSILEAFPIGEWQPDDVVGTNDPWLGTGHLFDFTILSPVFVEGGVVAFAAVSAHLPDIGGRGRDAGARDVFEEGLRIPPTRFATRKGIDPLLATILQANVRLPHEVMGDLSALLNAGKIITARLSGLCGELSVARFDESCAILEERTEMYVRGAIAAIPDGTYTASLKDEPFGSLTFGIEVCVEVKGDILRIDFAGTSPQVPAGINVAYCFTRSYAAYGMKCLLAPGLPLNEGILRPIHISAPVGCILNSQFPAAGSARSSVGHFIPTLLFKAIARALPHDCIGECGSPRPVVNLRGSDATHGAFSPLIIAAGGFGARSTKDGPACVAFPTNTEAAPIEMVELTTPFLFEEKELIMDSGGPGMFRGGLGQRVTLRCLTTEADAFVRIQRLTRPAEGILGGGAGRCARLLVNGNSVTDPLRRIGLGVNDRLTVESPGAGGYGRAQERTRSSVAGDVLDGYVSAEAAREEYGLDAAGGLSTATAAPREVGRRAGGRHPSEGSASQQQAGTGEAPHPPKENAG
jgi:N-methylhydantoinase B